MAETGAISASRRLLQRLRDLMASTGDVQERLDQVVRLIAGNMVAEVCSVYVMRAGEVLEGRRSHLEFGDIISDADVTKVSVIGVGMRSHAGVAGRMFATLAEKGINIQVISTSEIKVSVLVAEEYTELALRALHTAYGLDGD